MTSDGWRIATIGLLIQEGVILIHKDGNHGSNYPKVSEFGNVGILFLTAKLLDDAGNIDFANAPRLASEIADKFTFGFVETGDVLLSHNATVGRVAIVPKISERVLIGTSLTQFRLDASRLLPKYLAAYFSGRDFQNQLAAVMSQTTRNQVPITAQRKLSVVVPPLSEQERIAKILSAFDDKIELNRRINETLEAIARAMFKSWFVDFDPVRAKMSGEPPESICQRLGLTPDLLALFPDRLVDSELGEIPEDWEVHGLDSMATLSTKSVAPSAKPTEIFEHYSIPAFDTGATPSYEFGATIKSNKYVVSPNAVLVSKLNPETPRIWLPAVKTANAVCSTEFMQFEPRFDCVRSYLYLLMKSETMQAEILKRVTGSTGSRQRAQPSQIAVLPIVVPTEKGVKAFDLLIKPILTHAMSNVDQSQTLAALRDVLLPKLLSGELCVPQAELVSEAA